MPLTHLSASSPLSRRRLLMLAGLGGAGVLAACGDDSSRAASGPTSTSSATSSSAAPSTSAASTSSVPSTVASTSSVAAPSSTTAGSGDLTATPSETGGPFPADGSNDNGNGQVANILADARSVRSDIRADLDGTNVQAGVPFSLTTKVVERASGAPLAGAAVYIWHCSAAGEYSEYDSPMLGGDFTARSYLRGVQVTDATGAVTFRTILPGRYQGRAFHIHFEVYADSSYGTKRLTSQMAMDEKLVDSLYSAAGAGYAAALGNETTNAEDNVFADGVDHQLLTVTGDVTKGLTATFTAVV